MVTKYRIAVPGQSITHMVQTMRLVETRYQEVRLLEKAKQILRASTSTLYKIEWMKLILLKVQNSLFITTKRGKFYQEWGWVLRKFQIITTEFIFLIVATLRFRV